MRYCVNDECGHFVGTGNRAEFLDHVDQCSDCGAALVAQQPPVSPVDADAALVALESFRTVHDAALARSRLEAGGIQSWLKDEHINNVLPWLTTAVGGVKLLVDERDLIEARNALRGDATAIASTSTPSPANSLIPIEAFWLLLVLLGMITVTILLFMRAC